MPAHQRDATEIVQRFGKVRIERQCAFGGGDGFVQAAGETVHLGQIGVMARNLGSKPAHLLEVLDRFADLAVLLRDNAEQMPGIIRVL
jgi:hypothetical protein